MTHQLSAYKQLLLATTNRKKVGEMRSLLAGLPWTLNEADLSQAGDVVEDGGTFAENAAIKARARAAQFAIPAIGEDSGLVVDALGGEPGIYSARYAQSAATQQSDRDRDNYELLLERMRGLSGEQRRAYYVSSIAIALPDGTLAVAVEDRCCGLILEAPSGSGGFGYDPLFLVRELHQTFGQLSPAVKAAISHRGRAMRALRLQLSRLSG